MKIAFLDRDGTINIDYQDAKWKNKTTPEMMPNAIMGIQGLIDLGYKIIIITNQYIINDSIITTEDYQAFTKILSILLKITV